MHSGPQARHTGRIWQISLEQIEATVSEFLGPGRVKGNGRQSTFSRHVSMYLARHLGRWSYPKISHFYNSRHYTSVIAAIDKIERLRKADESVDALLEMLTFSAPKWRSVRQRHRNRSGGSSLSMQLQNGYVRYNRTHESNLGGSRRFGGHGRPDSLSSIPAGEISDVMKLDVSFGLRMPHSGR